MGSSGTSERYEEGFLSTVLFTHETGICLNRLRFPEVRLLRESHMSERQMRITTHDVMLGQLAHSWKRTSEFPLNVIHGLNVDAVIQIMHFTKCTFVFFKCTGDTKIAQNGTV